MIFLSTTGHAQNEKLHDSSHLVLHGLLHSSHLMVNFYSLTLKHDPLLAMITDQQGNLALHLLGHRHPFHLREQEAIEATMEENLQAMHIRNHDGYFPLLTTIWNKIPWSNSSVSWWWGKKRKVLSLFLPQSE